MKPLYSPQGDLIGWIDPGRAVFDCEMDYIAYVAEGHAWCAVEEIWLGPVDVLTLRDRNGQPVAWNPERVPSAAAAMMPIGRPMRPPQPMRPRRPMPPVRPLPPKHPLGGWSGLSFAAWRRAGRPEEPPSEENREVAEPSAQP